MFYLTYLGLGNNELHELPSSINNLKNLESINLQFNRFKSFPYVTLKLKRLQTLWIHNNAMPTIPISIGKMKKLEYLLVDHEVISDDNINQIKKTNPNLHVNREDCREYVGGIKRKE